jgi:signal transduction histidine kinase
VALASYTDRKAEVGEDELLALRTTARLTLEELDLRILCGALARQAASLFRAERCQITVLEGSEAVYAVAYVDGNLRQDLPLELGRDRSVANLAWRRRQGLYENQPEVGTSRAPGFLQERPCRNLLVLPVLNHQRTIIGLVEVHNRRDRAMFRTQDLQLGETFALQAAIGIERARLYDRMNDWSKSLEMLLSFNAAVNQHLAPQALLRRLVEYATRFLKADGGQAGLAVPLDQEDSLGMESEGYFHRNVWVERGQRWRKREGLPGLMLENEFPYLANDYATDRYGDVELVARFGIRRALCVPIKNTEHVVLGFFELHRGPEGAPFSWQDAAFLESLGNTTAVAIHNAQLLKALEAKNRQIVALSARNVQRLEQERMHISRELHDEAGQALIGIKLALQVLSKRIPDAMPELRAELDQLRAQVNEATTQLKNLARRLRPATLDQLGLEVALGQLASDFERLSAVRVELDIDRLEPAPSQDCATAIYRIAQEAITNAGRHAEATEARLALWRDEAGLIFEFEDNGRGFDPEATQAGLGLLGMKERVRILEGRIEIHSRPGEGTRITVEIPGGTLAA